MIISETEYKWKEILPFIETPASHPSIPDAFTGLIAVKIIRILFSRKNYRMIGYIIVWFVGRLQLMKDNIITDNSEQWFVNSYKNIPSIARHTVHFVLLTIKSAGIGVNLALIIFNLERPYFQFKK